MDKISIILVNYNGTNDTIECIRSINQSDYDNIDIIVVDNNSQESCDAITEMPNVTLIKCKENVGFGIANNIGAECAVTHDAAYIMCLNNDTVIGHDTIGKMLRVTNDTTITTCAIYYYDSDELWYGGGEISRWKGNFRHKYYTINRNVSFVSGCCFVMTVNLYKEIGLFEKEYFMYYEDGDFSIKAQTNGVSLLYIYDAKIWHKVGRSIDRNIGAKDYYLTRNRLYILKKYKHYFRYTAKIYYYITRYIYIIMALMKGNDPAPIIDGFKAYRKNQMGKRNV